MMRSIRVLKLLTLPLFAVFILRCSGQNKKAITADEQLTAAFEKFRAYSGEDSLDFQHKMGKMMKDTASFNYPFDRLAKHIRIVYSPDKKMRFYSWITAHPGPYKIIFCSYVQYRLYNGKIVLKDLSRVHNDYGWRGIYDVQEIYIDSVKHYVTLGGGMNSESYQTVRILKVVNDSLIDCLSCFQNNTPIRVMYNYFVKGSKAEMFFDQQTKNITVKFYDAQTGEPQGSSRMILFKDGKYYYDGE